MTKSEYEALASFHQAGSLLMGILKRLETVSKK